MTGQRHQMSCTDIGSVRLRYLRQDGVHGLQLTPLSADSRRTERRTTIDDDPAATAVAPRGVPAGALDPLALLHVRGDALQSGFSAGSTMRASTSMIGTEWVGQEADASCVTTTLRTTHGLRVIHRVRPAASGTALWFTTSVVNDTTSEVTLDSLSSFCLTAISPFDRADSAERLVLHRYRSAWSAEGRRESRSLEELHLERSWSGASILSERFGQVGTMPVRGWAPFAALEDVVTQVVWAAQVAWAGSWQLEVARRHDDVSLSGGLADREFGHWSLTLAPGEDVESPAVLVACVEGDLDDAHDALLAAQDDQDEPAAGEVLLPVVVNEFCTSWGAPTHDSVIRLAERLQHEPVEHLVIDAGWYRREGAGWWNSHGDWVPNEEHFPDGLAATAAAVRARGLVPGLWFEWETVGEESMASSLVDHLARRDGEVITMGSRKFWDLRDPWVQQYLADRVVGLIEEAGFGYIKVDYNETVGIGLDHPDGPGEGLRQQVLGSYALFELLRSRLPHVVVENCSSGGHRAEPSMVRLTHMTSITDAHETLNLPIIAANAQCLLPARTSQVWAVLRTKDDADRLLTTLAATFLGRPCLSGDLLDLSPWQWDLVRRALELYRRCAPVIAAGVSRRFGELSALRRRPRGWQAVRRVHNDHALIVLHAFADSPRALAVPLPGGDWIVQGELGGDEAAPPECADDHLYLKDVRPSSARVVLLSRSTSR